jgi:hypothetical protein
VPYVLLRLLHIRYSHIHFQPFEASAGIDSLQDPHPKTKTLTHSLHLYVFSPSLLL